MREAVRTVAVSTPVEDYVVDLVRATRERPELRLGSSPRSSVALYRAAQARAYLAGRDFVLPDDVKALVPAVLGHRVLLDIDRELRGSTVDGVIEAVLGSVAAPPGPGRRRSEPGLIDGPQRLHRAHRHRRRCADRCRRAAVRGPARGTGPRAPIGLVPVRAARPRIRTAPVRSPGAVGRAARSRPDRPQRQAAAASVASHRRPGHPRRGDRRPGVAALGDSAGSTSCARPGASAGSSASRGISRSSAPAEGRTGSSRPSCASPTCSRARSGSRSARSPRPIGWCHGS